MAITQISTANAPMPAGHYSQATVHLGVVYVAGQLPIDPATGKMIEGDMTAQARRALANVRAILEAAGSDFAHVLKMQVYVPDIALWGEFNAAYINVMGSAKPARAVIPTRDLKPGCLVEIDCIAAVRA
ncbi:MAG: RidA family protein [Gemmatimonadaceae bacterium]